MEKRREGRHDEACTVRSTDRTRAARRYPRPAQIARLKGTAIAERSLLRSIESKVLVIHNPVSTISHHPTPISIKVLLTKTSKIPAQRYPVNSPQDPDSERA